MLIRNVRPVPLRLGDRPSREPVDLHLEGVGDPRQVVDADGAWVIPGLWDQHVHLAQWALVSTRLDLSDVGSVAEACDRVVTRLAQRPGAPVVGWGHRPAAWPEPPTAAALDELAEHLPVVLIAGDAHHGWLNTAAQRALGLTEREGVVSEDEWFAAYARLGDIGGSQEAGPDAYRGSLEAAAAVGVTGVVDFEFAGGVAEWIERWEAGADLLRVRVATYANGLDDVLAAGLRTGDVLGGHDRLRMGPLKVISDGSLNTGTAWCCESYAGDNELPYGEPNQSPEELVDLLRRATEAGLDAAVHAIGDRAVEVALDTFAATGARGSIEHAQLVRPVDLPRMAALGLRASVQPAHLLDDRDATERMWPGRGDRSFALRSMARVGVELVFGSDAPVSPLDPWLAMAAAVHRSADERPGWHPEQSLTALESLAASVDGVQCVTQAGGDFVLLGDDPLRDVGEAAETAAHLVAMKHEVLATYVASQVVHER